MSSDNIFPDNRVKRTLSVQTLLPISFEKRNEMSYSPPSKQNTNAKIRILLPKLSIHCPNSVYVAGVHTYAILAFQVHVFVCSTKQTTYSFTFKTIGHLDLPHRRPHNATSGNRSICNMLPMSDWQLDEMLILKISDE